MATTKKPTTTDPKYIGYEPDHPPVLTVQQRAGASSTPNVTSTGAIAGSVKDAFANSPRVEDHPATLTAEQRAGASSTVKPPTTPTVTTAPTQTVAQPVVQQVSLPASTSPLNGVSQDLYNKMNQSFSVSQAYIDAMNYTNDLLKKLSEGKTSYTDQVKEMLDQINGREKFSYDPNADTMFQTYLSGMVDKGKMAMQDTMGQASALTGGYGSTYAQTAGNNAYNQYIQEAYGAMPDYYELAMQAYQAEGQDMYNKLNALSTADQDEYSRLYNSFLANSSRDQQMYTNEYNEWMSAVQNAFNLAGMQNSDFWNSTNFAESQRQFNQQMSLDYAKLAQAQSQFNTEMAYKNKALQWDQDQFNATMAYNTSKDASTSTTKSAYSTDQLDKITSGAINAYNTGGQTGLDRYLAGYTMLLDDQVMDIMNTVALYGYSNGELEDRVYTKVDDNTFKDEYGNVFKLADLPTSIIEEARNLKAGQTTSRKNNSTGIRG